MVHRRAVHSTVRSLVLLVLVLLVPGLVRDVAAQVSATPGGLRAPTVPREAPLVNWAEVTVSEFSLGREAPWAFDPFTTYSLESIDGSAHWVWRSYKWDASKKPVVTDTKVYPTGTRIVHAVTGYSPPNGRGWLGQPNITVALLVPIASAPLSASVARRIGPLNSRVDPAILARTPVAQAIGYVRASTAPPTRPARQPTCPRSSEYAAKGPPLVALCLVLEPGQYADLPNQTRITRTGNYYQVAVGGLAVEDLSIVEAIIRSNGAYFALNYVGWK